MAVGGVWPEIMCSLLVAGTALLPLWIKPPPGENRYAAASERVSFASGVITCFSKYAVFRGRASWSEYLSFAVFCCVIQLYSFTIDQQFGTGAGASGLFYAITALILTPPMIAVAVRRLHDRNRSGWWLVFQYSVATVVMVIWQLDELARAGM